VDQGRCTARAACRHFALHRSTLRYQAKQPNAWLAKLKAALRRLSNAYPMWGYPKITRLLQEDGWKVGCRRVQRLRRELGLMVPTKKPKRQRRGVSTGFPTKATHRGHVWTWDFVHDTTVRGGKLRMLNIIDEHTRECLCIHVARRINARKVQQVLAELIDLYGAPEYIRSDNGSEFIEHNLRAWLAENKIKTIYIDPGSPWQNGYIESFNARLREECLNREQLWTLTEARVVLEDWRWTYNHVRPHRSLGYITPLAFAQQEGGGVTADLSRGSSRAAPSFHPGLDLLYHCERLIHPARLTQAMGQFG
jgi:putative transposase